LTAHTGKPIKKPKIGIFANLGKNHPNLPLYNNIKVHKYQRYANYNQ